MTRAEVEKRREYGALNLLARSGVGYIYAVNSLDRVHLDMVKDIGLAGSDAEAIIKVAIQFAFSNNAAFETWLANTHNCLPDKRFFRGVR